jgi:hypothetical protein
MVPQLSSPAYPIAAPSKNEVHRVLVLDGGLRPAAGYRPLVAALVLAKSISDVIGILERFGFDPLACGRLIEGLVRTLPVPEDRRGS